MRAIDAWASPASTGAWNGTAAACFMTVSRHTRWKPTGRQKLNFPTYHPQGLTFAGDFAFLSSAEILEAPVADGVGSSPGRGVGHMFVLERDGALVRDIRVGERDMYHPSGIDFDGEFVWVAVAEYRPDSNSIVLSIDPLTLRVSERFRVQDHIGWVVSDPESGTIYGGDWGSRRFYAWSEDGRELDSWDNPSGFVDYQDCQYASGGHILCAGISILPLAHGDGVFELGGVALVDFPDHRIVHEAAIGLFSPAGHVVTRNPFALTIDGDELFLHVAPDDGTETDGTQLLVYRAESSTV